ncbi:MAG: hypothetical protein IJW40_05980 [Clostridia bacterium]|nr:hypothetical protein [Clostridia bacterium]
MLTNNKKRSFVKLLALTLAALMVFSVCLTGCTDEEARTAAENAQNTADAATTEEEVAAKIAEALAPYLKSADAITEDKVKSIVADSIKGCATTDDLAAYAKSADLKALSDKLADYVTDADVEKVVKNAMASYDIEKQVAAALEDLDTMSSSEVQKMIDKTLEKYLTADEIDERIAAVLEGYFGEFTAAEIQAMMTAMDKAMNLDDWNDATEAVIQVLADADDLLTRAQNNTFTQANKELINSLSGLVIFPKDTNGVYGDYDGDTADASMAALGIMILRAPNLTELDAIAGGIKEATAVKSLEDQLKDIRIRLYELGEVVDVFNYNGDKDNKNDDDGEKYAKDAAKANYHGENRAEKNVVAQVVTAADRAAFTAIQEDLDEMLIEYATGCVDFYFDTDDIWSVYTYTVKGDANKTVKTEIVKAGTYKNDGAYGATYSTNDSADFPSTWENVTFVKHTIGIDTAVATSGDVFAYNDPAKTYKMVGYYDGEYNDPTIAVDLADFGATGTLVTVLNLVTPESAKAVSTLANTYAAIIEMLANAEAANKAANDLFETFLRKIGVDKDNKLLSDADYLSKLVAYMCEETEDSNSVKVPATWKTAPWLTDVTVAIDYAEDINGNSNAGITKYPLYAQMVEKAYDLLFDKYQLKALEVLSIMLNDYTIAVQSAVEANAVPADYVAANDAAAKALSLINTTETTVWTDGFLAAYYNGGDYTWEIGPKHTYKGIAQYYNNNGVAYVPTLSGTTISYETVTSDVLAVISANAKLMQIELSAATVGPRMAILGATVDAKKATGVEVQKAFDEELKVAKANLDEIMYRYIYAEIKDAILNDIYSNVTATEGVYTNGLAVYFNEGTKSDAIEDILKKYVTGYNDAKKDTDAAYGFVYSKVMSGTTHVGYSVDKAGNGAVVDALNAIVVADSDKIVGTEIKPVATAAVAAAEKVHDDAIATMADKAVKYKFNDYLKEAKEVLYFSYMSYNLAATNYTDLNELLKIWNTHLEQITIVEYMNNRGVIAEADYLETYIGILNDVIASDSTYYALIKSGDKDTYGEFVKDVKSYGKTVKVDGAEGWENLIQPVAPYTGAAPYYATGTAMIDFDRQVNRNAVEKKADGSVKTASMY